MYIFIQWSLAKVQSAADPLPVKVSFERFLTYNEEMIMTGELLSLGCNVWKSYTVKNSNAPIGRLTIIMETTGGKMGLPIDVEQRFPTWGTCTTRGTFAYPKGYI